MVWLIYTWSNYWCSWICICHVSISYLLHLFFVPFFVFSHLLLTKHFMFPFNLLIYYISLKTYFSSSNFHLWKFATSWGEEKRVGAMIFSSDSSDDVISAEVSVIWLLLLLVHFQTCFFSLCIEFVRFLVLFSCQSNSSRSLTWTDGSRI